MDTIMQEQLQQKQEIIFLLRESILQTDTLLLTNTDLWFLNPNTTDMEVQEVQLLLRINMELLEVWLQHKIDMELHARLILDMEILNSRLYEHRQDMVLSHRTKLDKHLAPYKTPITVDSQ